MPVLTPPPLPLPTAMPPAPGPARRRFVMSVLSAPSRRHFSFCGCKLSLHSDFRAMVASSSGLAPAPQHGQPSSSDCVEEEQGSQRVGLGMDISTDIDADLQEVSQPPPLLSALAIGGRVAALRAVALRDRPVDEWMLRFLYAQRKQELDLYRRHLSAASGTPAFQEAIANVIASNRRLLEDLGIEQPHVCPPTKVRRSALRRSAGDVPPPSRTMRLSQDPP